MYTIGGHQWEVVDTDMLDGETVHIVECVDSVQPTMVVSEDGRMLGRWNDYCADGRM